LQRPQIGQGVDAELLQFGCEVDFQLGGRFVRSAPI
jgi:hypothetical protein